MSKARAYLICIVCIMVIFLSLFILVLIKKEELSMIPVAGSLTALVSITTAFMGIQMANNGVKGHNWNQQMFDSENKEENIN